MPGIVIRTDAEWRRMLTPEQYRVTRQRETEPAHSGWYRNFDGQGAYCCVCCGARLFSSREMFRAPSKWPAFWAPAAPESLVTRREIVGLVVRCEAACSRCDAHLGFLVEDGLSPTGRRYLINSAALSFVPQREPVRGEQCPASSAVPAR